MAGLNRRRRSGAHLPGPLDLQVRGAERLADVAKALRDAGDKELKKQLTKSLRTAAKPLVAEAKKAARDKLPEHGGLADRVARSRFSVQVRTSGRRLGVRITANGPKDQGGKPLNIRALNAGAFRHPVFARGEDREKWAWVEQQIKPGWFDDTLSARAPRVQGELVKAINEVARKIEKA